MPTTTINLISPTARPWPLPSSPTPTPTRLPPSSTAPTPSASNAAHGWRFADAQASGPAATELDAGPSFAGYPCSPTVDANGLPTWIIVDGKQAQRREKQGDVWYSVKLINGSYEQVLRIPKGEQAPPVRGV